MDRGHLQMKVGKGTGTTPLELKGLVKDFALTWKAKGSH